jgi:glycosyltransferase involved in cell wall biosynthesis
VFEGDQKAQVRVFLPTYHRPALLPRALESLLAQTFVDWKCEVHNDDPNDLLPAELVRTLGDPRIELHNHERNLGANATFNLFYRPTVETYYSLLEDDNWWEPEFLEIMVAEMRSHPHVVMAWCNQKIYEELPHGSWRDTGQLVNAAEDLSVPQIVKFGHFRQMMGALHGNGAMIMRSRAGETYEVPADWPFVAIEPFRERMMQYPLLFVPRPLAVFCKTLQTGRSESLREWATVQTILAATFLKYCSYSDACLTGFFAQARIMRPPLTTAMILAGLMETRCRRLLPHSRPIDWFLLFRGLVRRPRLFWDVMQSRRRHPDWWSLLDRYSAARFEEQRSDSTRDSFQNTRNQSLANLGSV